MTILIPSLVAALATSMQGQTTVPLYTNLGTHTHVVTAKTQAAQRYFSQGLRLIYAFNHAEAIASFQEALKSDPECAMCWWGIAHASGPNINVPMDSNSGAAAFEAVQKARGLAARTSPGEQAFIRAIATRYRGKPTADRAKLDSAFARAMADVYKAFPNDDDAATLYADALMNLSPWVYWTADSKPRTDTPAILEALEKVTARNPRHAGACHLYIHAVEAKFPKRAEVCADRLAALMPGAGHIVHMPGHIYVRVGRYADAIQANQHAIHEDETFIADRSPQGAYPLGYYPHNYAFLYFAGMMAGREDIALQTATALAAKSTPELLRMPGLAGGIQHYLEAPLSVHVRFEKWPDVLKAPAPPTDLPYATGLWRYSRGIAYARTGDVTRAESELAELRKIAALPALGQTYILGYNSGAAVLGIGVHVLLGEIAAARKDWNGAAQHLRQAATQEDGFVYIEPPEWAVPVRHSLGRVLMLAGRAADAEAAYREDLGRFPENVWALDGLAKSLDAQSKQAEAVQVRARLAKAKQGTAAVTHQN